MIDEYLDGGVSDKPGEENDMESVVDGGPCKFIDIGEGTLEVDDVGEVATQFGPSFVGLLVGDEADVLIGVVLEGDEQGGEVVHLAEDDEVIFDNAAQVGFPHEVVV